MIQQPTKQAFADDPDAQRAVARLAPRVGAYAKLTERLATTQFRSPEVKARAHREAIELRDNILAYTVTPGGIAPHEREAFWEAALEVARRLPGGPRNLEIYPLPSLGVPPAPAQRDDPVARKLQLLIIDREERWKRAGELLAEAKAKLAAHQAGKADQ